MTRRIAILSGTYRQFQDYLDFYVQPTERGDYMWAGSRENLQSTILTGVEVIGSFWTQPHAADIFSVAISRIRQ